MIINGFGGSEYGGRNARNNANVQRNLQGYPILPYTTGMTSSTKNGFGDSTSQVGTTQWSYFNVLRSVTIPANTTYNLDGICTVDSDLRQFRYKVIASFGDTLPEIHQYTPCIYGVYLSAAPDWTFTNESTYVYGVSRNGVFVNFGGFGGGLGYWPFTDEAPTQVYTHGEIRNGWTGGQPWDELKRNYSGSSSTTNYYLYTYGCIDSAGRGILFTGGAAWGCSLNFVVARYARDNSSIASTSCSATNSTAFTLSFGVMYSKLYKN